MDFGRLPVGASIEGPQTTLVVAASLQILPPTLPVPPVVCTILDGQDTPQ